MKGSGTSGMPAAQGVPLPLLLFALLLQCSLLLGDLLQNIKWKDVRVESIAPNNRHAIVSFHLKPQWVHLCVSCDETLFSLICRNDFLS
jgi:hypothetical protein